MKKLSIITLSLALLGSFYYFQTQSKQSQTNEVVVYQSRTCGCCKKWVSHLKDHGFNVRSEFVDDVAQLKTKMNVPLTLSSCHTAVVNGYIVEGHVPASAVKKLLSEAPSIKGITVPGMPMGSPGMEGSYKENFNVLAFEENGPAKIYMQF